MHAVISITESAHQSIDNNEFGNGIFIGLKKNFRYSELFNELSTTITKLEAMCINALYCIYPIESNLRLQVVMI